MYEAERPCLPIGQQNEGRERATQSLAPQGARAESMVRLGLPLPVPAVPWS